jgi:hypothetical protein
LIFSGYGETIGVLILTVFIKIAVKEAGSVRGDISFLSEPGITPSIFSPGVNSRNSLIKIKAWDVLDIFQNIF